MMMSIHRLSKLLYGSCAIFGGEDNQDAILKLVYNQTTEQPTDA